MKAREQFEEPHVLDELIPQFNALHAALSQYANESGEDSESIVDGCAQILSRLIDELEDVHNYIVDESVPRTKEGADQLADLLTDRKAKGGAR